MRDEWVLWRIMKIFYLKGKSTFKSLEVVKNIVGYFLFVGGRKGIVWEGC